MEMRVNAMRSDCLLSLLMGVIRCFANQMADMLLTLYCLPLCRAEVNICF